MKGPAPAVCAVTSPTRLHHAALSAVPAIAQQWSFEIRFDQAAAFRFLRQPSRPNAPRPVAKKWEGGLMSALPPKADMGGATRDVPLSANSGALRFNFHTF